MSEQREAYTVNGSGTEIAVSAIHETTKLSLSELREKLKERGVEIALSTLSDFLKEDGIPERLEIGRKGNRLLIPVAATDILAAFISDFREKDLKWEKQAATMFHQYLQSNADGALSDFRKNQKQEVDPYQVAAIQGREIGLAQRDDMPMTAQQAADFMQVSIPALRQTYKPYVRFGKSARGDRWRKSDLLNPPK